MVLNDMAENCVDVPEKRQLGTVLQKRILNMMYNAAKAGDEYCNALMRELYKTYYKKEYKQLKRFRTGMRTRKENACFIRKISRYKSRKRKRSR